MKSAANGLPNSLNNNFKKKYTLFIYVYFVFSILSYHYILVGVFFNTLLIIFFIFQVINYVWISTPESSRSEHKRFKLNRKKKHPATFIIKQQILSHSEIAFNTKKNVFSNKY